jgi:predicted ATPase
MNRFLEADKGRRQLVFVAGEPGAGKTTLIQLFMERLAGRPEATLVGAQCVMSFGAGEAYGPVLEALGRRARSSRGCSAGSRAPRGSGWRVSSTTRSSA